MLPVIAYRVHNSEGTIEVLIFIRIAFTKIEMDIEEEREGWRNYFFETKDSGHAQSIRSLLITGSRETERQRERESREMTVCWNLVRNSVFCLQRITSSTLCSALHKSPLVTLGIRGWAKRRCRTPADVAVVCVWGLWSFQPSCYLTLFTIVIMKHTYLSRFAIGDSQRKICINSWERRRDQQRVIKCGIRPALGTISTGNRQVETPWC